MRIVMMGTGTFAEATFREMLAGPHPVVGLVTQPDRPVGQERGSTRQTGQGMKNIALERGVGVLQPESINTEEGVAGLKVLAPELLVVAAYGQILSRDVLSVPRLGGINVHASLLPRYRGAAPVAWAIFNGEKRTGVTIIRMSTALDAGEMLAQEAVEIGPEETAGELEARLASLGATLARQIVDQLAAGPIRGTVQDKSLVTKAPKLKKENGLIDWTRSAGQVCNQVRAMQPWPTAYTFLQRGGHAPLRLIVCRARSVSGQSAEPGQPIVVEPMRLLVGAGENSAVEVLELQPAGKKRMQAAEFLRGHRLETGDRFADGEPPAGA